MNRSTSEWHMVVFTLPRPTHPRPTKYACTNERAIPNRSQKDRVHRWKLFGGE
jgi:hypothetical protein